MGFNRELSAEFWLVFGNGDTIDSARDAVLHADASDIRRWSDLGRDSFRKFEEIIENEIDGDGKLINKYCYKHSFIERLSVRIPRFPRYKITISKV